MDALTQEFLVACEIHSVARLRAVLDAGFDVRAPIAGASPVTTLVEMYYRSDAFPASLALLLAAGVAAPFDAVGAGAIGAGVEVEGVQFKLPGAGTARWKGSARRMRG